MSKKRRFSSKSKARVALEAFRGEKTVQEIAARYEIHPTRVGAWRDRAAAHLHLVFKDDEDTSFFREPLGQIVSGLLGVNYPHTLGLGSSVP